MFSWKSYQRNSEVEQKAIKEIQRWCKKLSKNFRGSAKIYQKTSEVVQKSYQTTSEVVIKAIKELHRWCKKLSKNFKVVQKAIKEFQNDANKFAFRAEKKNDLSILSKSNALKRTAIDKERNRSKLKLEKAKLMKLKECL